MDKRLMRVTIQPIAKRRVGLLKSMNRISDAILATMGILDFCPTDAESWSELSDLYFSQGLYSQAIYSLEEVIVLQPNAWNIQARLGELLYMAAKSGSQGSSTKHLAEALKRFCRSIELCDDYLRGYYGLKLVSHCLCSWVLHNSGAKCVANELQLGHNSPPQGTTKRQ